MDHLKVEKSYSFLCVKSGEPNLQLSTPHRPPNKNYPFFPIVATHVEKQHIFTLPVFRAFELDGVKKPRPDYRFKFLPRVQILQ